MTLFLAVAGGVFLGALGAYALFFSAAKAADPAALAQRLASLEERVRHLERR
ncbi:MAG: hypothetical protein FD126_2353 [Elusimicrobia bacterium]|nr:MAG: hypothetical protein FD126_2353 [Elusimicrobiota bacterium]